jgi:hypothetical protein
MRLTWFNINNEGGVARTLAIKRTYYREGIMKYILTQNKGNLAHDSIIRLCLMI